MRLEMCMSDPACRPLQGWFSMAAVAPLYRRATPGDLDQDTRIVGGDQWSL